MFWTKQLTSFPWLSTVLTQEKWTECSTRQDLRNKKSAHLSQRNCQTSYNRYVASMSTILQSEKRFCLSSQSSQGKGVGLFSHWVATAHTCIQGSLHRFWYLWLVRQQVSKCFILPVAQTSKLPEILAFAFCCSCVALFEVIANTNPSLETHISTSVHARQFSGWVWLSAGSELTYLFDGHERLPWKPSIAGKVNLIAIQQF